MAKWICWPWKSEKKFTKPTGPHHQWWCTTSHCAHVFRLSWIMFILDSTEGNMNDAPAQVQLHSSALPVPFLVYRFSSVVHCFYVFAPSSPYHRRHRCLASISCAHVHFLLLLGPCYTSPPTALPQYNIVLICRVACMFERDAVTIRLWGWAGLVWPISSTQPSSLILL